MMKFILVSIFIITNGLFSQEIKSEFKTTIKKEVQLNYILELPENYNPNDSLALLVFLHGSGERGTNLDMVKVHSPFTYKSLIKEPTAILAPQCPDNTWWDTEAIYLLVKNIISTYKIKPKKVYLTGLSMGGWGTIKLAEEHPELFAKVAPVCPPVDRLFLVNAGNLKNKPIKIFHGALDDVVPIQNSIDFYTELKKYNPNSELIIFENDNHNSWDSTYSSPDFYRWLAE